MEFALNTGHPTVVPGINQMLKEHPRPVSDIHPHVFYTNDGEGRNVILKKRKFRTSFLKRLLYYFSFRHEIRLLTGINKQSFEYLVLPEIYDTDRQSYMMQEKLDGQFLKLAVSERDHASVSKGMSELHRIRGDQYIDRWWKLFQRPLMTVGVSIHRGAGKLALTKRKPLAALAALRIFYASVLSSRKQKDYFFHHRDLINHDNSLILKDGRLGLIDFENARTEWRWVLMDIIDLSIDYDLVVNRKLLAACLSEVLSLCDRPVDVKNQVRIALLRRTMHFSRLHGARSEIFLLNTLLKHDEFEKWYNKNVNL